MPAAFDPDLAGAQATIAEIAHQPHVWRELARTLDDQLAAVGEFVRPILDAVNPRVILTGAGTSAFVGEIAAPALRRTLKVRVDAIATTDLVSNPGDYLSEDVPTLVISIARSGNSPESVAATRLSSTLLTDIRHLVITCSDDGLLHHEHQGRPDSFVILMPDSANDRAFAMTSSFSSMLLACLLTLGGHPMTVVEGLAQAATALFEQRQGDANRLAHLGYRRVVYLGSGPLKGLAQESALKLLELTAGQMVTYSDSPLGFRHGPKSVLDGHTMVVVYASQDPYTRQYDLSIVSEVRRSIGSDRVIVVSASSLPAGAGPAWVLPGLDGVTDELLAVVSVSVAQMIGLAFSIQAGATPDNPFPGGDVNRVVAGVEIYPFPGADPAEP